MLLANAASSGVVNKINSITVANTTGISAAATVSVYTNGAVAQGSAPSGGTAYPIISAGSVPANSTFIALDKSTSLYLQEGTSISITSSTASALTFVVSYEAIS